jgi:hypothetical protein
MIKKRLRIQVRVDNGNLTYMEKGISWHKEKSKGFRPFPALHTFPVSVKSFCLVCLNSFLSNTANVDVKHKWKMLIIVWKKNDKKKIKNTSQGWQR